MFPSYLGFISGIIDSPDIGLGISRELATNDKNLEIIIRNIEKKIYNELLNMLNNNREDYELLWDEFKEDLVSSCFQRNTDKRERNIEDLFIFKSSFEDEYTTLDAYVKRNSKQESIYYISANSIDHAKTLPQFEMVLNKNIETLYALSIQEELYFTSFVFKEKVIFESLINADTYVENIEEKILAKAKSDEFEALLKEMRKILEKEVEAVDFSFKSKRHPFYLEDIGEISSNLEKAFGYQSKIKSKRRLVLNPEHKLIDKINQIFLTEPTKINEIVYVIYNNARLMHGLPVGDPAKLTEYIVNLIDGYKA